MTNETLFFADNIPVGSVVSIYGENWILRGLTKIYDGDFVIERVELCSVSDPTLITFVHPTHQFCLVNKDIYSDCQDIPF